MKLVFKVNDSTEQKPDIMCLTDKIFEDIRTPGLVELGILFITALDDKNFDEIELKKETVEVEELKFIQDTDYEDNFTFHSNLVIDVPEEIWKTYPDNFKKHAESSGLFDLEFALSKGGKQYKLQSAWTGNKFQCTVELVS